MKLSNLAHLVLLRDYGFLATRAFVLSASQLHQLETANNQHFDLNESNKPATLGAIPIEPPSSVNKCPVVYVHTASGIKVREVFYDLERDEFLNLHLNRQRYLITISAYKPKD